MRQTELLNALRKKDPTVMRDFANHPEFLNSLMAIADNPVQWRPGMELKNANGNVSQASLGYQYTIQTTTLIRAEVIRQRFYEEAIADFAPVLVGTGAWMEDIKTNLTYDAAGPFESGFADVSSQSGIPNVEVALSSISAKLKLWQKGYTYSIPEVNKALASNNWDLVTSKHAALVKNWQLGIQSTGFLGLLSDLTNFPGLLSNDSVTVNNAFIGQPISTMSAEDFATFVAGIVQLYLANCNEVRYPDTFVMPRSDYAGLATPVSPQFPNVSKLEYLTNAFKAICGPSFKIMATAYANKARNQGYWASGGTNRYVLYCRDKETLHMDIPVDMFLNAPNTANNYQWNGVGCGQFSGVIAYKPLELLYLDDASSL